MTERKDRAFPLLAYTLVLPRLPNAPPHSCPYSSPDAGMGGGKVWEKPHPRSWELVPAP